MITTARELLLAMKDVTGEDFDDEAVKALESIFASYAHGIEHSGLGKTAQVKTGIIYGIFLGMQFAARGRRIRIEQIAQKQGIDPATGERLVKKGTTDGTGTEN